MADILKSGAVVLPAPVSLSSGDEIIWSKNTGRVTNAEMIGDVIAEKKTLDIKWGILTETELKLIKDNICAGFFPLTFHDDGIDLTIASYRGSLSREHMGYVGDGIYYYKSASAQVIQK